MPRLNGLDWLVIVAALVALVSLVIPRFAIPAHALEEHVER